MNRNSAILILSFPLAGLLILVSCIGLFTPNFYSGETLNWEAQSTGQDIIDLFLISPLLIITSLLAYKKKQIAFLVWSGINFYIIYTFVIYCFDVHFNKLFIFYCLIFGLSFYSFLFFIFSELKKPPPAKIYINSFVKITAIYFLSISCLFYFLWLSEIIPAIISGTKPKSLVETGLFTNPVQVIDLSIFLPGLFIISVWLLKRNVIALLFIPTMLVFLILMDITIGGLIIVMRRKGIEANYAITITMGGLALFSGFLLTRYSKNSRLGYNGHI